jgi:hypothetical protein
MQESFLHFVWQFQKFDASALLSTNQESIQVLKIGRLNTDAGADFQDARILIDSVEWAGSVEIHLKSSDWNLHAHQTDASYENVILHVVWQDDQPIVRHDGSLIPTLVLAPRTDKKLLTKYQALLQNKQEMPCQEQFKTVDNIQKISMLDTALMQRLQLKAGIAQEYLTQNQRDWEQTTYQLLARNFGFKLNAEPFAKIAQLLPLKILQKHRDNPKQIEAMIFGVAGFLAEQPLDEYQAVLKKEFQFLSAKYQLHASILGQHEWKYLRLRPANFPTVRLAQFAALVAQNANLFSTFLHLNNLKNFGQLLKIKQSDYWCNHYVFGKETHHQVPVMGNDSVVNIVINTVVPLLVTYANEKDNREYLAKAIELLEELPSENNTITKHWQTMGIPMKTAFDSQAGIEWFNNFCKVKKCLSCRVGTAILK